jgi:hypothetical protein
VSSSFAILALCMLALFSGQPVAPAGSEVFPCPTVQEPEDPGRILNLLDGLVERVQDSSPLLAAIIRFLGFLVWLVLNIKYWGPSVLVTALVVTGVLVWQGRRKKEIPPAPDELKEEPEA